MFKYSTYYILWYTTPNPIVYLLFSPGDLPIIYILTSHLFSIYNTLEFFIWCTIILHIILVYHSPFKVTHKSQLQQFSLFNYFSLSPTYYTYSHFSWIL